MPKHIALILACSWAVALPASSAALRPVDVERFFVTPGERSVLRWKGEPGGGVEYTVRDYGGRTVATGRAKAAAGGVEVAVTLPQGYYDVALATGGERFGIASLEAHRGQVDPFFSIDSAMSWLVRDDTVRRGLVRGLKRSGIAMSRERLSWAAIHPAGGKWDFEAAGRYERLRKAHRAEGVAMLEMFHDAPAHLGRVGKYPEALAATAGAWEAIAKRWHGLWGALEVWNEPDIFFGADLPADQYTALVKAVAFGLARGRIDTPLVGGVMAHYNRPFLDTAAACGMLAWVDALSFHTYGRAPQMEALVEHYQSFLSAHAVPSKPLWLTECGRPWKKGPPRPPADQGAASALDIVAKAIEARACGVARYFAFVYPYYEERTSNFGMMGKSATPLRSFAAYARLVGVLGGKDYLGDLRCDNKAVVRARVFGDADETVAAIYTGRADAKTAVKLPVPVVRAEGIDGRRLAVAAGAPVPVPDGLTYVWLGRAKLARHLDTQGRAMRLWRFSRRKPPRRVAPSPIILRYEFDRTAVDGSSKGYRLKGAAPGELALRVKAFNLSARPRAVTLAASFSKPGAKLLGAGERRATLPAGGSAIVAWQADLRRGFADGQVTFRVTASGDDGEALARLSVDLQGEPALAWSAVGDERHLRLPVQAVSRWTPNVPGHGRMEMIRTAEGHWRLTVTFGKGDPWVYPYFRLPKGVSLKGMSALWIRARCQGAADVRVFLWEGDTGVGYLTNSPILPADGKWHTARVRFDELTLSTANAPDADGRLDLAKVRRISIGLNSKAKRNTLAVSDVYVIRGKQ